MKGAYEFLVTVQPLPEDPRKMAVDAKCVLMNTRRKGYVTNSSWICDLGDGDKVIENSLVAACRWFSACVEQEERKLNNAVALVGNGK
jgi:hypothetical protein